MKTLIYTTAKAHLVRLLYEQCFPYNLLLIKMKIFIYKLILFISIYFKKWKY